MLCIDNTNHCHGDEVDSYLDIFSWTSSLTLTYYISLLIYSQKAAISPKQSGPTLKNNQKNILLFK